MHRIFPRSMLISDSLTAREMAPPSTRKFAAPVSIHVGRKIDAG